MFTLIATGVSVAWIYSLVATVAPWLFPQGLHAHRAPPVYFEAAAVIIVLVILGQVLELTAREKTATRSAPFLTSRRSARCESKPTVTSMRSR